jgi:hypothetical protein
MTRLTLQSILINTRVGHKLAFIKIKVIYIIDFFHGHAAAIALLIAKSLNSAHTHLPITQCACADFGDFAKHTMAAAAVKKIYYKGQ